MHSISKQTDSKNFLQSLMHSTSKLILHHLLCTPRVHRSPTNPLLRTPNASALDFHHLPRAEHLRQIKFGVLRLTIICSNTSHSNLLTNVPNNKMPQNPHSVREPQKRDVSGQTCLERTALDSATVLSKTSSRMSMNETLKSV